MQVDLEKPLMSGYRLRGHFWRLQYEGLHDICFECGRYKHRLKPCPLKGGEKNVDGGDSPNSIGGANNRGSG